jgi:hypothetical protein
MIALFEDNTEKEIKKIKSKRICKKKDSIVLSNNSLCAFDIEEYKKFIICVKDLFKVNTKSYASQHESMFRLTIQKGKVYFTKFYEKYYIKFEINSVCSNVDISVLLPHELFVKSTGIIEIISVDDNFIIVKVNGINVTYNNNVHKEDYDEYICDFSDVKKYVLSCDTFSKIKKACYFTAIDDINEEIQYVYVNNGDIVATNKKHMIIYNYDNVSDNENLLFFKSVKFFPDGECTIRVKNDMMNINVGNITSVIKTCDTFLPYKRIIPNNNCFHSQVVFNMDSIMNAIKNLSVFFNNISSKYILFKIKDDVCTLEVKYNGIQTINIDCEYKGEYNISFNGNLFMLILEHIKTGKVIIDIYKNAPAIIRGNDLNYKHIIMPLDYEINS